MTLELRSRWCAHRSPVGLVRMQPKSVGSNKLQKTVVLLPLDRTLSSQALALHCPTK